MHFPPFSLQHEFIYHILLLLTLIYQSRCKGKKVHAISVATTRKLLLSSLQHQTHSYHKLQVRPSHLKGVLLLLLLKTIILLILLIVYSWSLPNGSMSNSSSLSCEIWGSDTKKSPWMISFQKVPTHKILTGTRVIFHKDYFVNFELNWVQLLTPFNE